MFDVSIAPLSSAGPCVYSGWKYRFDFLAARTDCRSVTEATDKDITTMPACPPYTRTCIIQSLVQIPLNNARCPRMPRMPAPFTFQLSLVRQSCCLLLGRSLYTEIAPLLSARQTALTSRNSSWSRDPSRFQAAKVATSAPLAVCRSSARSAPSCRTNRLQVLLLIAI